MDIVVLDGGGEDFSSSGWEKVRKHPDVGKFTVYNATYTEEAIDRIGSAEIILMNNRTVLTEDIFAACPNIRYVGVVATGCNTVDVEAAARRKIAVTNIPGYSTPSVMQHVFALIFERTNAVHTHNEAVQKGEWRLSHRRPVEEIAGKTLGILGFGAIGQKTAAVALAFGMKVIAFTRSASRIAESSLDVKSVSFEELFAESDFLTLHTPLTRETRHIVNARALSLMKPSAMIINTARGDLVDEAAIRAALDEGKLACYAADVASEEPIKPDNPLLGAPNCIITPHVAWSSLESRKRLIAIAAQNVLAFLQGEKLNRVV